MIGVPLRSSMSVLDGLDALLSIVQMPPGVPVATVGVDNAKNAAVLAARILALAPGDSAMPAWRGSRLFGVIARYSRPEMSRIWSEEGKLARWLEVELAALDGWAEVGAVPAADVAAIRAGAATADAGAGRRDRADDRPRPRRVRRRRRRAARAGGALGALRAHVLGRRRHRARAADPGRRRAARSPASTARSPPSSGAPRSTGARSASAARTGSTPSRRRSAGSSPAGRSSSTGPRRGSSGRSRRAASASSPARSGRTPRSTPRSSASPASASASSRTRSRPR